MKALAAVLLLTVSSPAWAQSTTAPANFDQLVHDRIEATFRDPASAKVQMIRPPRWTSFQDASLRQVEGWAACYTVNGKNGFGGFTGPQTYVFVADGDAVIFDEVQTGRSHYRDQVVIDECSKAAPAGS